MFALPHHKNTFLQVQTVPYRVWCRLELQRRVEEMEGEEKDRLEQALKAGELWEPLWSGGKVEIRVPLISQSVTEGLHNGFLGAILCQSQPKKISDFYLHF